MDINTIKEYNSRLTRLQKEVAQRLAEQNIRQQELKALCTELTEEIGRPVTPDNIEEIYNTYVEKIQSNIATGTEILNRVESELSLSGQSLQSAQTLQTPQQGYQVQQQWQQPVQAKIQQELQQQQLNTQAYQQQQINQDSELITPNNKLGNNLINFDSLTALDI